MNIRNIITKIFSLTLILGVMFFGVNYVSAACLNNMSTWSATPPWNAQSSGNCRSYAPNWDDRYNNQTEFVWANTEIFFAMYNFSQPSCSSSEVVRIQTKMQELWPDCSTCIDGKAGDITRAKLESSCLSLACPEPLYAPIMEGWSLGCLDGELTENNCCDPTEYTRFCNNPPIITVEWWDTYSSYPKTVTIDYSSNTDPDGLFNFWVVWDLEIQGWNRENLQTDTWTRITTFDVVPLLLDEITITAKAGLWKIWTENCPSATKTLTRWSDCWDPLQSNGADCCMPKADWELCYNKDPLQALKNDYLEINPWVLDFWWIDDNECEYLLEDNSLLWYWFCPSCDTPPVNWSCTYYSTWHGLNWECCEECWGNQKVENNQCVCGLTWCTDPWEIVDPEACECVCNPSVACCGIKLNTVVPFIGDCIEMTTQNSTAGANWNSTYVNQLNAFPFLMMGLSKILVTVILIFSFLVIIAAWLMMVTWVYEEGNYSKWLERIKKIIVALILLWSSGLILKLINPTFFGW